ncbi:hypothetical protein VIGAN_01426900, partial [Vigna angularis var. angularis]
LPPNSLSLFLSLRFVSSHLRLTLFSLSVISVSSHPNSPLLSVRGGVAVRIVRGAEVWRWVWWWFVGSDWCVQIFVGLPSEYMTQQYQLGVQSSYSQKFPLQRVLR